MLSVYYREVKRETITTNIADLHAISDSILDIRGLAVGEVPMKHITLKDKPIVKIRLGYKYKITDYEGNDIPGAWVPLKKQGNWYLTQTPYGGYCHVKPGEFKEAL